MEKGMALFKKSNQTEKRKRNWKVDLLNTKKLFHLSCGKQSL
jgi:hypothetical protein